MVGADIGRRRRGGIAAHLDAEGRQLGDGLRVADFDGDHVRLMPTLASVGVPVSAPVAVLNVAQAGTLVGAEGDADRRRGRAAVGVNE